MIWGCNDNVEPGIDPNQDLVKVKIMIPNNITFFPGQTRADSQNQYLANGEGVLSNLYVIAIQETYEDELDKKLYKMDKDRIIVLPLNVYDDKGVMEQYDSYELTLYPGHYSFYVFANCDLYADSKYVASGQFTKEDLKKFVLNYSTSIPLRRGHLPMICLPDKMQFATSGSTNPHPAQKNVEVKDYNNNSYTLQDVIEITASNPPTIYADLSFLCSKVRYTILFDDTQAVWDDDSNKYTTEEGISAGFGNQSIRFYVDESGDYTPTATNLRKTTFLYSDEFSDKDKENSDYQPFLMNVLDKATWNLELNRYIWPESGENYPLTPSDELEAWDATQGLDDWKNKRQRVWQGIVYLPENNDDDIDHTYLTFPYVLDTYPVGEEPYKDGQPSESQVKKIYLFGSNDNEQHYDGSNLENEYSDELTNHAHGLQRGYFYDVVALVKNPDEWDLKVIVYGKVEDWHDIEQSITEGNKNNKENDASVDTQSQNWQYENNSYKW